jgi:hypothetical protein
MFARLRKALFGDPNHEVLGGADSDHARSASAALGGTGAMSDHHRSSSDDGAAPAHGDDEFSPRVPPDPPA